MENIWNEMKGRKMKLKRKSERNVKKEGRKVESKWKKKQNGMKEKNKKLSEGI